MFAEALKNKTMELRKARDPMSTFLVAVSSKAGDLAKAENPEKPIITDDHALRAINSFIKGADDNLSLLASYPESPAFVRATAERELLKSFLPQETSEDDVRAEVRDWLMSQPEIDRKKAMGPIIKHLSERFGASLNKKTASGLVMAELNA